jgi:hypothetical protein
MKQSTVTENDYFLLWPSGLYGYVVLQEDTDIKKYHASPVFKLENGGSVYLYTEISEKHASCVFALNIKTACSETSVSAKKLTSCQIPDVHTLNIPRREDVQAPLLTLLLSLSSQVKHSAATDLSPTTVDRAECCTNVCLFLKPHCLAAVKPVMCRKLKTFVQVRITRHRKAQPYQRLVCGTYTVRPHLRRFNTGKPHPPGK